MCATWFVRSFCAINGVALTRFYGLWMGFPFLFSKLSQSLIKRNYHRNKYFRVLLFIFQVSQRNGVDFELLDNNKQEGKQAHNRYFSYNTSQLQICYLIFVEIKVPPNSSPLLSHIAHLVCNENAVNCNAHL